MSKCPYCQSGLTEGLIECDGRSSLLWVEKGVKRGFLSKAFKKDCIVLGKTNYRRIQVESNYCEPCEKIIVDISSNDDE